MKVFVTRYLGMILEREVSPAPHISPTYLTCCQDRFASYNLGKDAFEKKEDAIADAEVRRDKKIKSLQQQIKKLQKTRFDQ